MMNIPKGSKLLNPYASEFQPKYSDIHCLFLTFSNGFPLTESQIFTFFNRVYAPYVEDVYVHKPRSIGKVAKPSLFGKVVFKHRLIPQDIMGSGERVSLCIDGVPLYCKRYVSQKNKTKTHGGYE